MRKKTKRKIYPLVNPIDMAISGAGVTDDERLSELKTKEDASLKAFQDGVATVSDWHNINQVVRLAESLADANVGANVMVYAKIAEMHLLQAHDKYKVTSKMGTTDLGLQAFQDILEYHDLQRRSIARSEYEGHCKKIHNKLVSRSPKIKFL